MVADRQASWRLSRAIRATVSAALRALVALAAAGPGERLLHRVAGDHAEGAGHAGLQLHVLDPARGLGADEVVVVGLAADHDPEAGDPAVGSPVDQLASRRSELVGAGDRELGHVGHRDAGDREALVGAVHQAAARSS